MSPPRARRPAALDAAGLIEAAGRGEAPRVLLVTGGDWFSRDAALAELKDRLVAEGFEGLDAAATSGEEVSGPELADGAEVLPMGGIAGGSRFILVRRAERIREREVEAIARYAASPAPGTCLVLVFEESKGPALAALRGRAPAVDFPAPRDYQLARWLETQARRLGVALDQDAARALAELAGEDFIAAYSDLQRTALVAGARRVTRPLVEELAGAGQDTNPFHLSDAVFGGEPWRAVRILRDLHGAGQSGYMVLGLLSGQLRKFLRMRASMAAGATSHEAARRESSMLPPPVLARLARQLEAFDETRLASVFRASRAADRAMKTAGTGGDLPHLESLIWKIAATGAR